MAKSRSPKKGSNGNVNGTEIPSTTPLDPMTGLAPVETASTTATEPVQAEKKSSVRKAPRKPEMVKAESRSNLVPINMEDEIRCLAYLLSERRGFEPGHETEDWLNAEHEVLQRYHHQQTATA